MADTTHHHTETSHDDTDTATTYDDMREASVKLVLTHGDTDTDSYDDYTDSIDEGTDTSSSDEGTDTDSSDEDTDTDTIDDDEREASVKLVCTRRHRHY